MGQLSNSCGRFFTILIVIYKPYIFIPYFAKTFVFFLITVFYLDAFKLSNDKFIKYSQILFFFLSICYVIYFLFSIYLGEYVIINSDIICNVVDSGDDNVNKAATNEKKIILLYKVK